MVKSLSDNADFDAQGDAIPKVNSWKELRTRRKNNYLFWRV